VAEAIVYEITRPIDTFPVPDEAGYTDFVPVKYLWMIENSRDQPDLSELYGYGFNIGTLTRYRRNAEQ